MPEIWAKPATPRITTSFNSKLSSYARQIQSTKSSAYICVLTSPFPHHKRTVDLVLAGCAALGNDICHQSTAGIAGETLLCIKY